MVMATQNPIELEGTFPLPEAQLDRFIMNVKMGYPSIEDDRVILTRFRRDDPLDELTPVITAEELMEMQTACREIHVNTDVEDYIISLIHATRETDTVQLGASPRAMLALYRASQSMAAMRGRSFVIPDDVKYLAPAVLGHRIISRMESHLRGQTAGETLKVIIESVSVPVEQEAVGKEE
jgi:MoxR-like ATPase